MDPTSQAHAGPRPELAELYSREQAPMLRLACVLVGSRPLAEEIVHDAFAAVGERWSTIANPGGYLRTSVVNGCRMALRRRDVARRRVPADPEPVAPPDELVELAMALDHLPDRARAVIVLRYLVDLPDAEIAEAVGCRIATVRSIAHRALRVLRKELS
jgi:RNA polymerase sigma factor (sigma-70 family)